ncbi:hypothetical protein [Desertivirga arenae]|uniref:hypothetical protein n=1 Tax=Desertivirga arenae TaxID=2810309 RepID=UPI001A96EDF7|nr:hypothetical protein [Pedobacter sp. SYSU D00823]
MKKVFLIIATITAISAASAQTKPVKKAEADQKEHCKKEGGSCCSPSSKAKALIKAKPAATSEKKG